MATCQLNRFGASDSELLHRANLLSYGMWSLWTTPASYSTHFVHHILDNSVLDLRQRNEITYRVQQQHCLGLAVDDSSLAHLGRRVNT